MIRDRFPTIITITITILLAVTVYSLEFNVFNTESSLMSSTKKYIHNFEEGKKYEPKYVLSQKIGSQMIVVFSDNKYENFMGAVVFQQGITGLWRPIKAQYETGPIIQSISTNENSGKNVYTAYFSANCPSEVKSYKIEGNIYSDKQKEYINNNSVKKKITASKFIDLFRQDGFAELSLYDKDGIVLSKEKYLAINQQYPNVAIGSAELGLINIFCFIIIAIGGYIAWLFTKKKMQRVFSPFSRNTDNIKTSANYCSQLTSRITQVKYFTPTQSLKVVCL